MAKKQPKSGDGLSFLDDLKGDVGEPVAKAKPVIESPYVDTGGIKMRVLPGKGCVQTGADTFGPGDTFIIKGGKGNGTTPATTAESECARVESLGIAERV